MLIMGTCKNINPIYYSCCNKKHFAIYSVLNTVHCTNIKTYLIGLKILILKKSGMQFPPTSACISERTTKLLKTSYSVIGKYERDEMQPSIEAAKKIAKLVDTTVGYLLGETDEENILKDPEMLKRLNEIEKMDNEDKGSILKVLDGFIKSVRLKSIAVL